MAKAWPVQALYDLASFFSRLDANGMQLSCR
jgi:hypothetical protein